MPTTLRSLKKENTGQGGLTCKKILSAVLTNAIANILHE